MVAIAAITPLFLLGTARLDDEPELGPWPGLCGGRHSDRAAGDDSHRKTTVFLMRK